MNEIVTKEGHLEVMVTLSVVKFYYFRIFYNYIHLFEYVQGTRIDHGCIDVFACDLQDYEIIIDIDYCRAIDCTTGLSIGSYWIIAMRYRTLGCV